MGRGAASGPWSSSRASSDWTPPPSAGIGAALVGLIAQSVELRTFNGSPTPTLTDSRDLTDAIEDRGNPSEGAQPLRAAVTAASVDAVETALAKALEGATEAGRWDVVAQLARELEARRLGRSENVVTLDTARRRR